MVLRCKHALALVRKLCELLGRSQCTRTPLVEQLAGQRAHSFLGATVAAAVIVCLLLSVDAVAERVALGKRRRRRLVA